MSSQQPQPDVNVLKFSALKVDVTSLHVVRTTSSDRHRHRPVMVAVASNLTRSRDVVKMVAKKLGVDAQQVPLIQLVALVSCKSLTNETISDRAAGGGSYVEIVLDDDEHPLSIYDEHPRHCVRFQLQWKRTNDLHVADSQHYIQTNAARKNDATTNTRTSVAALRGAESLAHSAAGAHNPLTSSRAPVMTSHGQQASLPWQRRCAESGGDCVTQYERCAADTAVLDRRPAVRGSQHGCHAIAERDERSSDSSPEFGRWRDRSHAANGPYSFRHPHGTRSSAHELSSRGAAVDNVRELAGDVCGRAVNRHLRVNGLSHAAVDIHRPHSNLAVTAGSAALSDVSSTDHHQQHHAWGRATSLSAGSVDSCAQRPLVKFYSLPDLQVIDGQRRRRRTSTGGSDVTEDRCADSSAVFGFESSMCRQSTFVSMPCISSSSSSQHHQRHQRGAGRRLTPKRFLPTLSISAEAVEAKRKSLSAMLCEKLQRVSEKRKHSKNKSAKSKSSKSFISKSQLHNDSRTTCLSSAATQSVRRNGAAGAVVIDDDCMSVTSREVAAILSTAGPMAPPSDDEYSHTEYDDDDDVSELEQRGGRLSSALQLLRVSSCSSRSTSPSNTSTAASSSIELATPVYPGRTNVVTARLNNGWAAGRDGDGPKLNGLCDRSDVRRRQVNGLQVSTVQAGLGGQQHQQLTLFELVNSHELLVSCLELRLNNGRRHVTGPPFQVINDVIHTSAYNSASRWTSTGRHNSAPLKITVPIVSSLHAAKNRHDWQMTSSSEYIRPGDVIVEVNGVNVLAESAVTVLDLLVSSTRLNIVHARPRLRPTLT